MNLRDRTILVTGAGRRLGRAIALELGRAGAWIAAHHHRSDDGAQDVIDALEGRGATYRADLSHREEGERLIDRVVADRGGLDGVVLNAATFPRTPFGQVSEADWDDVFATNLKTPFFVAQRAASHLKRAGGAIVLLTDVSAEHPWVDRLPYCLTKAGISALTPALAKALAPEARANAIAPGPVLPATGASPDEIEVVAASALLGRFGGAESVGHAARYLMEADFVTGHILPVDGGQRIKRAR